MPFGLKFKKTRRYYVSGKNSFVARIQLLDNTFMECTLPVEGTGQDCLEIIGQKLELEELMYFGLLYINKNYKLRWVELEKPLKKQLDKNGHDTLLRFGVMLYTSNVQNLQQEITRYLYFLQLKSDIIEGILPCSLEQAILLASYAVQAEFGDYDPEHHTLEFLKDYILLPKNIKIDTEAQSELLQEVINTYKQHIGLSPDMAELAYISESSQLDGYGQESYPAKDEHGYDLLLGASFIGIFVKHLNGQPTVYFKWNDIVNVTHSKRLFGIEKAHSEQTIFFQMEDAENAKYVWRMCNTQHQFYRVNLENQRQNRNEVSLDGPTRGLTKSPATSSIERRPTLVNRHHANTQNYVITKRPPKQLSTSEGVNDADGLPSPSSPNPEIIHFADGSKVDHINNHGNVMLIENGLSNHAHSINSLNQGMQLHISPMSSNLSVASNEPRTALSPLPAYRASPDYNTVLRAKQKLAEVGEHSQSLGNLGVGHVYHNGLYYEPNSVYGAAMNGSVPRQMALSYSNPNTNISSSVIDTSSESLQYPSVNQNLYNQVMLTYSTPELSKQYHSAEEYVTEKLLKNKFKPPPPYPRGSTSTPDLARHSNFSVSHSSPDLVSRRLRSSIEPVQEVTDDIANTYSSSGNVVHVSNVDLSQSLPVEGFSNLHLNSNISPPVMHPLRRHEQQHLNYYNGVSPLHMRPGYLNLTNPDPQLVPLQIYQSDPALRDNHIPHSHHVVRPPSDFADTSDMDSPNIIYSPPPAYKHVPGVASGEVFFTQNGYIPEEHKSPTSPVSPRQFSPKQLERSAEMQELNTSQFALQNYHETNIVQSRPRTVSAPDTLQETHFGASMPNYEQVTSDSSVTMSPVSNQPPLSPSHMSISSVTTTGSGTTDSDSEIHCKEKDDDEDIIGPLKLAAMNGLTLIRPGKTTDDASTHPKHPRDARRKILENQITEGQVFTEYEKIARRKPNASYYTAQLPDNEGRNLFPDVLPYEDTRVKLATMVDNRTGYINASHIRVPIAGEIVHYIASQAPMENTVKDWWRMIWEQEVQVIVMLTALEEEGKQKCHPYWPSFNTPNNMVEFGPFKIIGQFSNDSGCYITSGLTIRHIPSGEQRTVWHLQYTDWPNQGCPLDIYGFFTFIEEFQSVCRHANSLHEKPAASPVLVHCVAGVGRTGVLILTDAMINSLEHNEEINIAKMLNLIRQQRMFMIQTVGQYQFVYRTLIHSLKNTRLI